VSVEGSVWSPNAQFDELMSVSGADRFGQKDVTYLSVGQNGMLADGPSLYGGFKGAGWVLPDYNRSRIGLQRSQSWLEYFNGPDTGVMVRV
jgi:hypothetical protein